LGFQPEESRGDKLLKISSIEPMVSLYAYQCRLVNQDLRSQCVDRKSMIRWDSIIVLGYDDVQLKVLGESIDIDFYLPLACDVKAALLSQVLTIYEWVNHR